MKMMFIVDDYSGGAGNIVQLLSTEYAKKDDVEVLLTHHHSDKRYQCKNVKFVELDVEKKPHGVRAVSYQIRWIKKQVNNCKPDVIISFLTPNSVFAGIGLLFNKIPFIACERICPADLKLNCIWRVLMKIAYNRANAVTVQFSSFMNMYDGEYLDKCFVTPNYISEPKMIKVISAHRENENISFISCGRLNASKQFEIMIDIFNEVHQTLPNTELHIYGKGPYQDRLQLQIAKLGLEDAVFLEGYTTDTYGVLVKSDIYLMTSKSEGFPNALSEAMAAGLPSVSFSCNPGIDELVDFGRRGLVVPLDDKQAFIESVYKLCDDISLQREIGKNAQEVSDIYSMEKIKEYWDRVIAASVSKK